MPASVSRGGSAGWMISGSSWGSKPSILRFRPSKTSSTRVAARELLQQVVVKAGYHDASVTSCRPNVVRYKPGSRCTVVVDVDYDPDQRITNPAPIRSSSKPIRATRDRLPGRP